MKFEPYILIVTYVSNSVESTVQSKNISTVYERRTLEIG